MSLTYRRARPTDVETIVEIWMAMMRDHEAVEDYVRLAPDADRHYREYAGYHVMNSDAAIFVADNGVEVVGFALGYKAKNLPMFQPDHYGYLSDLAVRADYRDQGVGKELLQRFIQFFRERGLHVMQLQVYINNERGRQFWAGRGFMPYVSGLWLDI